MPKRKKNVSFFAANKEAKIVNEAKTENENVTGHFPFLYLPEDLKKTIPYMVDGSEDDAVRIMAKLSLMCKSLNSLYKPKLQAHCAKKILSAVIKADYALVAKLITNNLASIFIDVEIDIDHKTERMSPLKYAFKYLDTEMWQLFYKKIKENKDDKALETFTQQFYQTTEYINLDKLFAAYDTYAVVGRNLNPKALAEAQVKFLPAYIIKKLTNGKANKIFGKPSDRIKFLTLIQSTGLLFGYENFDAITNSAFTIGIIRNVFVNSKNKIIEIVSKGLEDILNLQNELKTHYAESAKPKPGKN